jgi:hypothetical protein
MRFLCMVFVLFLVLELYTLCLAKFASWLHGDEGVEAYSSITVNTRLIPPGPRGLPFGEQIVPNTTTSATNNKTEEHAGALYTCFPGKWIRGQIKPHRLLWSSSTFTAESCELCSKQCSGLKSCAFFLSFGASIFASSFHPLCDYFLSSFSPVVGDGVAQSVRLQWLGYGLGNRSSIPGRTGFFSSPHRLWGLPSPFQWVHGFCSGVKRSECEADHSYIQCRS